MNKKIVEGKWEQFKAKVKSKERSMKKAFKSLIILTGAITSLYAVDFTHSDVIKMNGKCGQNVSEHRDEATVEFKNMDSSFTVELPNDDILCEDDVASGKFNFSKQLDMSYTINNQSGNQVKIRIVSAESPGGDYQGSKIMLGGEEVDNKILEIPAHESRTFNYMFHSKHHTMPSMLTRTCTTTAVQVPQYNVEIQYPAGIKPFSADTIIPWIKTNTGSSCAYRGLQKVNAEFANFTGEYKKENKVNPNCSVDIKLVQNSGKTSTLLISKSAKSGQLCNIHPE